MFAVTQLREYPQSKVCRILGIPTSTYYYAKGHQYTKRDSNNLQVLNMFYKHNGSFGRRTIRKELLKEDISISEYRISKILKENDLIAKYGRKRCHNVHTHKNTQEKYIQENLYLRLTNEEKKQEIWSMDFTEQRVSGKKVYTCGIISTNRKILLATVIGKANNSKTACEAVEKAIRIYGIPCMIQTDRGSPFTSKLFYELLNKYGIAHSMSRPHTPVDNVYIETFWKSMKIEIGAVKELTVEQYKAIIRYYEYYYNNERPHSTLGYCTPMECYLQQTT